MFSLSNLRKLTLPRSVNGGGGQIVPSHLYVRFKPQTQEHITAIENANIPTYPYPLATDSLNISNPDYSTLYTFLSINKVMPACPYEVLDTVMMLNPESSGAAAAYTAAGRADRIPLKADGTTVPRLAYLTLEPMLCDQWDDGPSDNMDNTYAQTLDEYNDCGGGYPPPPPPPTEPEPLEPADPRPAPATVTFNSCSMNTDDNFPSGRITVEETQWGNGGVAYEGVADVKVEILGPMGQRVTAQTNRHGCFKATGAIRGYKIWRPFADPKLLPVVMNVIFESDRKTIKGMNRTIPQQYTQPLIHLYDNIEDRMNNANVSYERHTSVDGDDTKYYVAATVNNALYDFDEYAAQDGILPPPNGIKILVTAFASAGSAPMFNDLKSRNIWDAAAAGNYLNTRVGGLGGILAPSAPDIIFGYNFSSSEQYATDQIKEIAYHEFSHASHYRKTSTEMWIDNIKFVADHQGYGNAGDNGVERTDLIEMWGYFIGRTYAHRRYGPERHSLSTSPTFFNSWYGRNERIMFEFENTDPPTPPSEIHIPSGFLHDIVDDNNYNRDEGLNEGFEAADDSIHGYSIATIYNQLDGSTSSAADLINKLRQYLPTGIGNTTDSYDRLRNIYGY